MKYSSTSLKLRFKLYIQSDNDKRPYLKVKVLNDIIETLRSAWSSHVLLVEKKNGTDRICIYNRKRNAFTARNSYIFSNISSILDKQRNAHYLSSLDIKSSYWQFLVAESSREYTVVILPGRGLYKVLYHIIGQ